MAQVLPVNTDCCTTCEDTTTNVQIPGPTGAAGAAGAAGTDGISAYTTVTTHFHQPAVGANVNIVVADNRWMVPGETIYIGTGGYYEVITVDAGDQTLVTVENLLADAGGGVPNAAVATEIPVNSKVSPSGLPGEDGNDPAAGTYLAIANNLGDGGLVPATMRTNLGLGTAATQNIAAFLATGALGVTVQAYNAKLLSLAATAGTANTVPYFSALNTFSLTSLTAYAITLLGAATAAAARALLTCGNRYGLLGYKLVDLHEGDDVVNQIEMVVSTPATRKYIIRKVTILYYDTNLATGHAGVYTAAGGGGSEIVALTDLTAVNAANKFIDGTLATAATTTVQTAQYLQVLVNPVEPVDPSYAHFLIWGEDLSGTLP